MGFMLVLIAVIVAASKADERSYHDMKEFMAHVDEYKRIKNDDSGV